MDGLFLKRLKTVHITNVVKGSSMDGLFLK